jgi:hypothetical protein
MAKTSRTAKAKTTKRPPGRPPADPGDLRTERMALRLHPDLMYELGVATREAGTNKSLFIERLLINHLNDRLVRRAATPLDVIGRYVKDEELEKMYEAAEPPSFANMRDQITSEGFAYRMPVPGSFGLPRRVPPPKKPK